MDQDSWKKTIRSIEAKKKQDQILLLLRLFSHKEKQALPKKTIQDLLETIHPQPTQEELGNVVLSLCTPPPGVVKDFKEGDVINNRTQAMGRLVYLANASAGASNNVEYIYMNELELKERLRKKGRDPQIISDILEKQQDRRLNAQIAGQHIIDEFGIQPEELGRFVADTLGLELE